MRKMNLEEQMREWHQSKTLLRLVMLDKKLGESTHVGNLIYVDDKVKNIMFYDLDQKKNYNFSTSEIEEIYPFDSKKTNQAKDDKGKIPVKTEAKPETKTVTKAGNKIEGQTDVRIEDMSASFRPGMGRGLQIDIRKNCMEIIQKLPDDDLMAIMPIIQHLAHKNSPRK